MWYENVWYPKGEAEASVDKLETVEWTVLAAIFNELVS